MSLTRKFKQPKTENSEIVIEQESEILFSTSQSAEALKHTQSYTELLNIYVKSVDSNMKLKNFLKVLFFILTMGSMIFIVYLFYLSLNYTFTSFSKFNNLNEISIEAIISIITLLVPAISSLIVAFIKIPEIIAEYLFNIKEENYMNFVIKNIQDYDKAMFAMENKIEETLLKNKEQCEDESIEDSPIEIAK